MEERRGTKASGLRTGSLLLLTLLLGAQQSQGTQVCGRRHVSLTRIVEGNDTKEGEFPWQASVQWKGVHMCGASLINQEWLITAAHCFYQLRNLTQYRVVLGILQLQNPGPHSRACPVQRIIPNPNYAGQTTSGDIALIQLATPVNFSDYILPICLPDTSIRFPPGKECWVTGWGNLRPWVDLPSPQTLQKLQVPIIDTKTCKSLYRTNGVNRPPYRDIQDDMICAGYAEGLRDACNGDSGGPMMCIVGDVWVLAGVVSWGEGCAIKNRPGVYSRLTSYQNWIQEYVPNIEFIKESKGRKSRDVANIIGQKHPDEVWASHAASAAVSTLVLLACLLYLI
ncbi:serine protease 27-like [Pelodiscus sinensis]|uniref:serine protease 27-like n=1 Tax=Pelodiscus sinensis TaxID=13735 RepID=UPI003F6D7269